MIAVLLWLVGCAFMLESFSDVFAFLILRCIATYVCDETVVVGPLVCVFAQVALALLAVLGSTVLTKFGIKVDLRSH